MLIPLFHPAKSGGQDLSSIIEEKHTFKDVLVQLGLRDMIQPVKYLNPYDIECDGIESYHSLECMRIAYINYSWNLQAKKGN